MNWPRRLVIMGSIVTFVGTMAVTTPKILEAWPAILPAVKEWFWPPAAFALKHVEIARGRAREAASAARAAAGTYPSYEIEDALRKTAAVVAKGAPVNFDGGREWGRTPTSVLNGYGKSVFDTGDIFEGEFKKANLDGLGCQTTAKEDKITERYCGRFVARNITGTSQRTIFVDATMNQRVTWPESHEFAVVEFFKAVGTTVAGARYEGQLMEDQRNGYGVLYFPDGSRYEGQWWETEPNGFGAKVTSSGSVEQAGLWEKGAYIGNR